MVAGQFLLNLSDPSTINLFIMTSILVSIALIPISLSSRPAPEFDEPDHLPLKRLFKISPLGLAGCFCTGVSGGTLFGLGAVYASEIGISISQISTFMALFIFGGVATQIPIGWISDRYDRRIVLIVIALLSALASLICFSVSSHPLSLNFMMFILGSLSLPIYGLAMAHITDHLTPKQYVAGSSSAILINGLGAAIGPLTLSVAMKI